MNALREALLLGRRRPRVSGSGSPTLYRGDGYEFVELRQYSPGDDVRRIDWAATARSGSLQTRVVLEDVALTLAALVDTSDSMQAGRTRALSAGAAEALALWESAANREDRRLRVFSDDVYEFPLESSAAFILEDALNVAAAVLPRGTALLVISDFWDAPGDELFAFLGRRFDCTALVARDPWFDGLPLSGFVRVRDAETSISAQLYIGPAERERYAQATRDREAHLMETLRSANWRVEALEWHEDGAGALLRAFGLR